MVRVCIHLAGHYKGIGNSINLCLNLSNISWIIGFLGIGIVDIGIGWIIRVVKANGGSLAGWKVLAHLLRDSLHSTHLQPHLHTIGRLYDY